MFICFCTFCDHFARSSTRTQRFISARYTAGVKCRIPLFSLIKGRSDKTFIVPEARHDAEEDRNEIQTGKAGLDCAVDERDL